MSQYHIIKRKWSGKIHWYVRFNNPDTGLRENSAVSLEEIRKSCNMGFDPITSKSRAESVVDEAIKLGYSAVPKSRQVNLTDYLRDFWDYDHSQYLIDDRNLNGSASITRGTAHKNQQNILLHVVHSDHNPKDSTGKVIGYYLPDNLMAHNLKIEHLEKLQRSILGDKKLNAKSWLNILNAISVPIKELVRTQVIFRDPLPLLKKPKNLQTRTDIRALTQEEVEKLCHYALTTTKPGSMWKKQSIAILLAAATGMRESEVRALSWKNIYKDEEGDYAYICVAEAWGRHDGKKAPKNGKSRFTFCPKVLIQYMEQELGHKSGFIFCSDKGPNAIMSDSALLKRFDSLLKDLGIKKKSEEGKACVHSLRHYCSTQIVAKAGADSEQAVLGHGEVSSMTVRYNHASLETIKIHASKIGSLLPSSIIEELKGMVHGDVVADVAVAEAEAEATD